MENLHPYTGKFRKERCGFGRWHTILFRVCKETSKEIRIVKNWSGPRPKGAIECPHCHKFMDI